MVQAARSIKQNIAKGSTDSQTSSAVGLNLLGIARGSNKELLEDYQEYLKRKGWQEWFGHSNRFDGLHHCCKEHSKLEDYQPLFPPMNDEELANMTICLCHQVDAAMTKYIQRLDRKFTTEGGIKERTAGAARDAEGHHCPSTAGDSGPEGGNSQPKGPIRRSRKDWITRIVLEVRKNWIIWKVRRVWKDRQVLGLASISGKTSCFTQLHVGASCSHLRNFYMKR